MAMLEARPYRPFKSSEEYLEAMKEDLAEWLNTLYPSLTICAENFMDRLDTGVALCKHANYVRQAAEEYLARRQARHKSMTRSMTSGLAGPILAMGNIHFLPAAKSGTFFARDNVSNFITWCRKSLKIIECLLFETDDLIMRKNEKHVILCLLEVARRGAKFGMLAPMLVQMERQIDREIAADNKANGIGCGTQTDSSSNGTQTIGVGTETVDTETDMFDIDDDSDNEEDEDPVLMYGPQPQIITNDLKSLDEMVRDLVEKCTCPSQFPMVRVSEGKYRIGDTKVLIFVRILRSHVMVRVGGGWDTLSHYLDKHDPCRCKAQHRSAVAARLIPRTNNQSNGIELHKAQVIFERSPPVTRRIIASFNNNATASASQTSPTAAAASTSALNQSNGSSSSNTSPSYAAYKNSSRSPTPQHKLLQHLSNETEKPLPPTTAPTLSANLSRRSMSPSPRRLIDMRKKPNCNDNAAKILAENQNGSHHVQFEATTMDGAGSVAAAVAANVDNNSKFENISDNGSEISDEGYRSLGLIQSTNNAQKRESLHSQASTEDAETNARLDQTCSDSAHSPLESAKTSDSLDTDLNNTTSSAELITIDAGPQSLPAVLCTSPCEPNNKFAQSGVFITDDEITVDIANATGLRKTAFANKILGDNTDNAKVSSSTTKTVSASKIPRSPVAQRRRSIDNSTCNSGSLQDLHARTGLPVFNRQKPMYRSVRKPAVVATPTKSKVSNASKALPAVRDVTNTWSGRGKKRAPLNADTFTPSVVAATPSTGFERNSKLRSSHVVYDSNGRRIKGCASSLTTSPVKNYGTSPLAQQLLEAASSAKNDAQILEKMKTLLSRYSSSNQQVGAAGSNAKFKKGAIYDDFTSAWVHSNGNLERSNSCSPPAKARSKRSSAASSTESTQSRDMSVIVSPRRDNRGVSRIPAPVMRQHTELY